VYRDGVDAQPGLGLGDVHAESDHHHPGRPVDLQRDRVAVGGRGVRRCVQVALPAKSIAAPGSGATTAIHNPRQPGVAARPGVGLSPAPRRPGRSRRVAGARVQPPQVHFSPHLHGLQVQFLLGSLDMAPPEIDTRWGYE
jgi:hypothetical protein